MSDREEFLGWVRSELTDAELALHNGDAGPRRALWSRSEPVTVHDMAYTVAYERSRLSVNGFARSQVLRAAQVYRREDGVWKVAHRHGDFVPDADQAQT